MKRIITIFLLILSVAYMLPISAMVNKETQYSVVDIDEEKEDNKKEKKLEVVIAENILPKTIISIKIIYKSTSCTLSTLFHTVETPPPDLA
jgi:Na+-transporting methylmalonyl-CoA/oxaloacetate decarboxylase gamma subunit